MLAVIHNEDDFVVGYAEYFIVNPDGTHNDSGTHAFILDCWVHPKYRNKKILQQLIKDSHKKSSQLTSIYYKRRKYGGKMKEYRIERMYD